MTFDEMRLAFPHLSFSVYGLERLPGDRPGTVTLEALLPDGTTITSKAWTLDAAILDMFPPEEQPTPVKPPPAAEPPSPRRPSLFD